MNWEQYKSNLERGALLLGYNDKKIKRVLKYSENLFKNKVPVIFNAKHLSLLVGFKTRYIMGVANSPAHYYRSFSIKKKNGKLREISEPLPALKEIQKWILEEILVKLNPEKYVKSYIKGKSIKDNARFHVNKNRILIIDIKNFFPSIGYGRIFYIFKCIGYSKRVATLLSNLCCKDNSLPQGAPTSAQLSNLVMRKFDRRVGGYCEKCKIIYTRYADDLTFSGNFNEDILISFIEIILHEEGFCINKEKTRTLKQNAKQIVTGIVVNKKMQAPRLSRRKLRQEVYYIKKFGINNHLSMINSHDLNYIKKLAGRAGFMAFVNRNDKDLEEYVLYLKQLNIEKTISFNYNK